MANDVRTTASALNVQELSRVVGMSPRNIRAHQARRLLSPPVRKGRTVLYDETHVQRLRTILALQRQGFNLVSIEAMLGARDPDAPAVTSPQCVNAPTRVLALRLHGLGLAPADTPHVLGELLDRLTSVTEELIRQGSERILSLIPQAAPGGSFEDLERHAAAVTDAITRVMSEAFRMAVEKCGEAVVATSVNRRHGLEFAMDLDPSQFMDNG